MGVLHAGSKSSCDGCATGGHTISKGGYLLRTEAFAIWAWYRDALDIVIVMTMSNRSETE
eukprot:scaffold232091_cov39-Tisochrysis_lutea.AAC.2